MTIKDVAKRAGVGIATVSRTLHNSPRLDPETAARVRKAIEELGYRPNINAQSPVSGHSRMPGLVVSDITNPFFPELVKGFEEVAPQNGYDYGEATPHRGCLRGLRCAPAVDPDSGCGRGVSGGHFAGDSRIDRQTLTPPWRGSRWAGARNRCVRKKITLNQAAPPWSVLNCIQI
jgi:hypothetical protein